MKTTRLLLAATAALALAGCAHVNQVGVKTKSFAISAGKTGSTSASARPAGGPPHCPPGHARKGEC